MMGVAGLVAASGTVQAAVDAPVHQAPMSLTASDGSGLKLVSLQARGVVEDPLAFTELHLTFHNPEQRQIEGQFEITLPPGAAVSRFAMRQSWGWQEGEVVELQAARVAYEDFLHRRQDPALLEKQGGNQFHARVFPIQAGADKEIIISYSQELPRVEEPYRIYLKGLPKVDALDIKVFLGKRESGHAQTTLGGSVMSHEVVEVSKRHFTPDVDFAVAPPASDGGTRLGLRHENLTVARITPVTDAAPDPVENLLILFDTSASRALGFEAQVARLAEIVAELKRATGPQVPLEVACFDQEVVDVYDGNLGGFGKNQLQPILDRRALGASDLGRALDWAGKRARRWSRVLVVSDGVATAGPTDGQELRKVISTLGNAGVKRLDVVVTGGIRDEAALKRLTAGGLSHDGVVLDDELPSSTIARRMGLATYSGIKLSVPGAGWVWPTQLDGIQPGDQVLVYADLPRDKKLVVQVDGAAVGQHPVRLAEVQRPLLERAWVNARIQRLEHQRETLAASDPDLRAALKKQIIEISTRYRVLCDYTALLVLETDADYARFHIDRRALSDILVVGAGGIELEHRTAVADQQPRPVFTPPVDKPDEPETRNGIEDETKSEEVNFDGHSGKKSKGKEGGIEAPPGHHTIVLKPPPQPREPSVEKPSPPQHHANSGGDRPNAAAEAPAPVATPSLPAPPPPPRPEPREHAREPERRIAPNTSTPPPGQPTVNDPSPQADRDGDGIPDSVDRCPNEPENYNGFEDEDGCPDRGRVIVSSSSITILEKINFESGSSELKRATWPILDAVAAVLRENPQIVRIELQGHTDEKERNGQRIAADRADSVRRALTARGIDAGRLVARGYGFSKPLCGSHNEECWAKNRRVEFVILNRSDGAVAQPAPPHPNPPPAPPKPPETSPYEGKLKEVMMLLKSQKAAEANKLALAWRDAEPGDVLALIALGETWEAQGKKKQAARAYGSLIDLFPARADVRRFAGERLERLGQDGSELAIDTYRQARAQRADHPASHRLLAYALLRAGRPEAAFDAAVEGMRQQYPAGRFLGVDRILREDVGLIGAAWIRRDGAAKKRVLERLESLGVALAEGHSLRFVLNWETDANDVDFHIFDAQGNHAFYQAKQLSSGGELYADVTTGYGPECFTITGKPAAYPYKLQAHYYSRGPMGYGMGKLEVIEHDGQGNLTFDERPFVIMTNGAFVDLGQVTGPLAKR
jgi:outer membrane protein OmpA-like peptidoglycan-associated protein